MNATDGKPQETRKGLDLTDLKLNLFVLAFVS